MKLHSREWPKCHAYQIQGVQNGNVSLCISYAYKKKQSIIVVVVQSTCMCLRRSCFSRSESTQDKEPTKAATVFQMTISLWVPPLYRESSLENPLLWLKIFCLFRKIIRGDMISNTTLQILPYFWNIKTVHFYKYVKTVFINYQVLNVKKV